MLKTPDNVSYDSRHQNNNIQEDCVEGRRKRVWIESRVMLTFKGRLGRRPYRGNREGPARDGRQEYGVIDPKRVF